MEIKFKVIVEGLYKAECSLNKEWQNTLKKLTDENKKRFFKRSNKKIIDVALKKTLQNLVSKIENDYSIEPAILPKVKIIKIDDKSLDLEITFQDANYAGKSSHSKRRVFKSSTQNLGAVNDISTKVVRNVFDIKVSNSTSVVGKALGEFFIKIGTSFAALVVAAPVVAATGGIIQKEEIIHVSSIQCKSDISINVNDKFYFDDLEIKVLPNNAKDKTYTINSENPEYVEVIDNYIIGKKDTSDIDPVNLNIISNDGGHIATCKVTVNPEIIHVTGITLDKKSTIVLTYLTDMLTATITPSTATDKTINWISNDDTIATVFEGEIYGVSPGSTTIIAKTNDGGYTDECLVTVKDQSEMIDFNSCEWSQINELCDKLENNEISEQQFCSSFLLDTGLVATSMKDFIGQERNVKVNTQDHRVRVIDVQHDLIVENDVVTNKKAAFTFEFANLISDSEGYSLAWQWNDSATNPNLDYPNSSIRKALCAKGNFSTYVFCAQKGQTTWAGDSYTNRAIVTMFPSDLHNVLKVVQKSVGTGDNYQESKYNDELFMLSLKEMGISNINDKGYGSVYSYYENAEQNPELLKKKQVADDILVDVDNYIIPNDKGQVCRKDVKNYAGFNNNPYGGYYWLRSPTGNSGKTNAFVIKFDGNYASQMDCAEKAFGVAPAFCI